MERLNDRVAFITGSARGIGRGIAERFIREGAKVAVADLNAEGARDTAEALGENALGLGCDVTSAESIREALAQVTGLWRAPDIVVNSAGYSKIAPLEATTEALWDRTLAINLKGAFLVCRETVPAMKNAGWGRVINLSSQSGKAGNSSYVAYCSSKFGVIGLTQALAQELAADGITVNAICPGIVFTEMWSAEQIGDYAKKRNMKPEEVKDYLVGKIPMKRAATVEDVAAVAAFLASDEASYQTGQSFNVSGGQVMH